MIWSREFNNSHCDESKRRPWIQINSPCVSPNGTRSVSYPTPDPARSLSVTPGRLGAGHGRQDLSNPGTAHTRIGATGSVGRVWHSDHRGDQGALHWWIRATPAVGQLAGATIGHHHWWYPHRKIGPRSGGVLQVESRSWLGYILSWTKSSSNSW